jgi:Protein of unknown function (DUF1552)
MKMTRRQVLRGAGGFTLAIPFLPSLVNPRDARSATAPVKKRFVQFCTDHGGIWGPNMYPADATLTDVMPYAGRTAKRGKLAAQAGAGGAAVLSPVLQGPATVLTPALVAKMNVIRGCDVPWYIGHHTGGHLGNFARNDGNGKDGTLMQGHPTPTIDQVMAWSPKFYTDLATIRQRVIVVGSRVSYNWSNPAMPQNLGPVQEVAGSRDAIGLFKQIFVTNSGGAVDPNAMMLSPLVDRVQADYKRLRNASTRLSSDDRHRLDDHMQRMSELQRRLNVHASCPSLPPVTTNTATLWDKPTFGIDPALNTQFFQAMNDVIVAAFLCDTSRLAVVKIDNNFSPYVGDWHQDIAHHANDPTGSQQKTILTAHQLVFEKVFLDLLTKLDVDEGNGKTYLDNSLVSWTQEAGEYTHAGQGQPIITGGSGGGFLSTGNYCDYRNPAFVVDNGEGGNGTVKIYGGLLWQQWLGTALQTMGLPRTDYEQNGLGGYPTAFKYRGPDFLKSYPDDVWNVAGEVLPFLKG